MDLLNVALVIWFASLAINPRFINGSSRTIIRHCCDIGKHWYTSSDHTCSTHPMFDNAKDKYTPCLLAIEICCTAEMKKQRCLVGKISALPGGVNADSSEDAKECYNCCRLGLRANKDLKGCQKLPRSHLFTSQCRQTFVQCCNQENMNNLTLPAKALDPCSNYGLHCSTTEKCVEHKYRGFVCLPVKNEKDLIQDGSRTTLHNRISFDLTSLHESVNNCPKGYTFNRNLLQCEDINECAELPQACDSAHTCRNEPGGYECLSTPIEFENEVLKIHHHRHRHSDAQTINHHSQLENHETTKHHRRGSFRPEHSQTFHSKFDANDESVASIDHPTISMDGDFFAEVNNIFVGATHDSKDTRERDFLDGNSGKQSTRSMCGEGQKFNEIRKECEDITRCDGRFCRNENMICKTILGKEFCTCRPGYRYNPRAESCDDINECSENIGECLKNERCHNFPGSYRCLSIVGNCQRGFSYDMISSQCTDVDECASNSHNCTSPQICSNIPGSFRCLAPHPCAPGMIADMNGRCRTMTNDCNVDQSLCLENQSCVNIGGKYICRDLISCGAGFKLDTDVNQCQDVDECTEKLHNCTDHLMYCSNLIGQYTCKCTLGYKYNGRTHSCEDVNECLSDEACPDNSRCINEIGSFLCGCELGFQIGESGLCIDINECSAGFHSCEQECMNTIGSYFCSCQQGFKLESNGFMCSDVDECVQNNECQNGAGMCINLWGGHDCYPVVCPDGFVRQRLSDRKIELPLLSKRLGDHKQVNLSLFPSSNKKSPDASQFFPIGHQRRHKSNIIGQSGLTYFSFPIVLKVSEGVEFACKRIPCPMSSLDCRTNSTRSIQWHQLLLPTQGLNSRTPVITIRAPDGSFPSGSSFRIVGGNDESVFHIRRVSVGQVDRGDIHMRRDLNIHETFELIVLIVNLRMNNEHIINIIINTTPR